jgi:hypothetical protein
MTPLHAVAISGPGRATPSIAELAEKPGLARAVVVTAGTAEQVWSAPRIVEQLYLGATLVLLFQDAAEAAAFEAKLAQVRARAARGKVSTPWAPKLPAAPRRARPVLLA